MELLKHIYNEFLVGHQIETGYGPWVGKIRVQWSDGRTFWHSQRFIETQTYAQNDHN